MNKLILIGRLTRDPELKFSAGSGTAVTLFTIAVNRRASKDGTKAADFINIKAFGKTAETIANYVSKGHQIAINGRLQTGSYDAKDGTKKYTMEVILDEFDFLEKKAASSGFSEYVGDDFTQVNDGETPF